jgi:D-serine deaminase-like pyridoxal phosphate-dependent protein
VPGSKRQEGEVSPAGPLMEAERTLAATQDMETPLAVVDLAAMERNLARMAAIAGDAGLRLRPHAKTHKSPYVARRQLDHGAAGLTVATLREAEVFADAGVVDLLLAHPPAGGPKLKRLERLQARVGRVAVSLDDLGLALSLPDEVEIMWEVDTGLHRVGTQPGEETVAAVRALVAQLRDSRRFRGLITHAGHAYRSRDQEQRRRAAEEEATGLLETARLLREHGIEVRELSVGSTPTAEHTPAYSGITEMRPGTYVYGDANQVALGSHRLDECALGVLATIVSTPDRERAVADAGSKSLSADLLVPGLRGYGIVLGRPELSVERLSEEHAVLTASGSGTGLRVGDRVVIVPAHVCTTVNLHPALLFLGQDGGSRLEPVAARGWG